MHIDFLRVRGTLIGENALYLPQIIQLLTIMKKNKTVNDAIARLEDILNSLNQDDRIEVYDYLTSKMMLDMFGGNLDDGQPADKPRVADGGSPFGEPVFKGRKAPQDDKVSLEALASRAIYDTTVEDVRRLTLLVEMEGIEPAIWREVVVPSNLNLESLGHILVDVMGWNGYHLHQFIKGNDFYSIPDEEFGGVSLGGLWGVSRVKKHDSRDFTVGDVLARKRSWIDYEYDFGDSWMHRVTVEDSRKYGKDEPRCVELIAGANACPPEDCGGAWGYEEMLEALKKPRSKRAQEYKEWLGYKFDPTEFDLEEMKEAVNYYNE